MRIIVFTLLLIFTTSLSAQDQSAHFPEDWLGEWVGELEIYTAKGVAQTIGMELHIKDRGEAGKWGWTIIYKGDKTDERSYDLVLKDADKAHFVIDEKNSIFLDAFYLGNTLISRFSVNQALLMINYTFEPDKIIFDVFSGNKDTSLVTGEEVPDVEEIRSYQMGNRQRAILYKRE